MCLVVVFLFHCILFFASVFCCAICVLFFRYYVFMRRRHVTPQVGEQAAYADPPGRPWRRILRKLWDKRAFVSIPLNHARPRHPAPCYFTSMFVRVCFAFFGCVPMFFFVVLPVCAIVCLFVYNSSFL